MSTGIGGVLVKVTGIKCSDLPNVGLLKRSGKHYVKLCIEKDTKSTTDSTRGNVAIWNDTFYFDKTQRSSLLEIKVYARRTVGSDDDVGGLKETIDTLLAEGTTKAVVRKLCKYDARGNASELPTIIEFTISVFATSDEAAVVQMDDAVECGKTAYDCMTCMTSASLGLEGAMDVAADLNVTGITLEPLLTKIELCTKIVDRITEIHPYAKIAWTVVSSAHKALLAQKFRDESIGRLVDTMNDTYEFVHEAEPLKTIESHKRIIALILQQTTECGYFIRDYCKNKNFWKRTMMNLVSDVDSKVEQYRVKFNQLRSSLQEHALVHTSITVFRVLDAVENLNAEIALNDMPYAEGARYDADKGCLPGTRREVIDEITKWVNEDAEDVSRVFLLSGMAGTGKSAIVHTVAHLFDGFGRLGSSYCFNRAYQGDRSPENLFSTIARDLADMDPERKSSLWQVIDGKKALRTTRAPREQFEKFILYPSASVKSVGPLLIVIDALDECGDRESRQSLLTILANQAADLPSNFRFLVTARAERDILEFLDGKAHVISRAMDAIDATSTTGDIYQFVKTQLGDIASLDRKWPNDSWCNLLSKYSEGLFQWASTACRFIQGDGGEGLDPVERTDILVSATSRSTQLSSLDQLYTDILTRTFKPTRNPIGIRRFKAVMGIVMVAKQPLSISSLKELCDGDDTADAVEWIIRPLGSLLSGVTDRDSPVRPLHTSFRDFLTDEDRGGLFYIGASGQDRLLALSSLRIMMSHLRFNICQVATSYVPNNDLLAYHARDRDAITPHLSYSCRFYADHLRATLFDVDIADQVREFLHTRLLFWLEVLSLTNGIDFALKALLSITEWSQDDSITLFARDSYKFVVAFRSAISQSAPHIYLSAVPFAPEKSIISQVYLPQFPRLLQIRCGKVVNWPSVQSVLRHPVAVMSVACSEDGRYIVSGARDNMVRVWDVETGIIILGPLEGHTNEINSVAFSPDGKYIASGSDDKTIRIWNAVTGKIISRPLEGHTGLVTSVAFYSNGKRVVSGSGDGTIRVWDIGTGDVAFEIHAGCLHSLACSPNGKRIASASHSTVRVWDAETGILVAGPIEGHTNQVISVAFSRDGQRIVSGSADRTVRVWDTETGNVVSGPFEGHTGFVSSVSFSGDGLRIVSGSRDKTVRVWDAKTGHTISGPFLGHTHFVVSVAFAKDGKRIMSGSWDGTVRVWDSDSLDLGSQSFEFHAGCFTSVVYSPDGKCIVAGSHDWAIRVWDAETGNIILGPLKGHSGCVASVAFSPDGKYIVSGSHDATIKVWNAATGSAVSGQFNGHTRSVNSVAFAPSMRVVSGSDDKTIRVWDAWTGELVSGPFEGHTDIINSIALSPDGMYIVSGSDDKTIRVWKAETGEVISGPLEGHTDLVTAVAFSADGKYIVSGSRDATIRIWETETGDVVCGPFKGHSAGITSVAFSPNSERVVSGSNDKSVQLWDAKTGAPVSGPFEGHSHIVTSVAFSPDGERVVSGGWDSMIRIWDAEVEEIVSTPIERTQLSEAVFRPDSRMESGWIRNKSSLVFWVPPWSQSGLWRPNNIVIIGAGMGVTKVDLSNFVHGTSWQQCRDPL